MTKERFEFLSRVATIISLIVGVIGLLIGIYALNLAFNSDFKISQSTDAAVSASSSASEAVKLAENNSTLVVQEGEKTREVIVQEGDKTRQAVTQEGGKTREVIVQEGDKTRQVVVEEGDKTREVIVQEGDKTRQTVTQEGGKTREVIVQEGDKTRQVILQEGDKSREVYKEGVNLTVSALNEIVSILSNNRPDDEQQQNGEVDPTYYLEVPELKSDAQESLYFFDDGALVLPYPDNSNVYEILETYPLEINQLPLQDKTDLIILPGTHEKSQVQEIKSVAEVFPNVEITTVPIQENSKAILPLWRIISETISIKNSSQSELNEDGAAIENGLEIAYGTPLTLVFPK